MRMKKTLIGMVAGAMLATTAVPSYALDDGARLAIGIGAAIIQGIANNAQQRQQAQPRQQQPQRQQAAPRSSGSYSAPAQVQAPKPKRQADPQVKTAQQKLIDLGYPVKGGADGFFGAGTASAIKLFAAEQGFAGDAVVTPELLAALDKGEPRDVVLARKAGQGTQTAEEPSSPTPSLATPFLEDDAKVAEMAEQIQPVYDEAGAYWGDFDAETRKKIDEAEKLGMKRSLAIAGITGASGPIFDEVPITPEEAAAAEQFVRENNPQVREIPISSNPVAAMETDPAPTEQATPTTAVAPVEQPKAEPVAAEPEPKPEPVPAKPKLDVDL